MRKSAVPIKLRHLTLTPTGGIGNRLRAIASARRLCQGVGATCAIVWDWGEFENFFEPLTDVTFLRVAESAGHVRVRHQLVSQDPSPLRTVDVTLERVELVSGTVFWGSHEERIADWAVLRPFLPRLSDPLLERVEQFDRQHSLASAVGMHIRRTDHRNAIQYSPDHLFVNAAQKVVSSGGRVFLATDNVATATELQRRFPGAILTFPKRTNLECRWPRAFTPEATEDDLVELILLSRTSYVLGSYWSSYSYLAIVLNGSKRSEILELKWSVRLREWGRKLRWWRRRFGLP